MNLYFALAAAALEAASLGGKSAEAIAQFEAAITARDQEGLAKAVDQLETLETPADGRLQTNPLMNGIVGITLLRQGDPVSALVLLSNVEGAHFTPFLAGEVAIAKAEALYRTGDTAGAVEAFAHAQTLTLDKDQQQRRLIGLARALSVEQPADALALLDQNLNVFTDKQYDWQRELTAANAHLVRNDREAARSAAERAWLASLAAPAEDGAPARTANFLAALAALEGPPSAYGAMLVTAGSQAGNYEAFDSNWLPACAESGLKPEETLIALFDQRDGQVRVYGKAGGAVGARLTRIANSIAKAPTGGPIAMRCRQSPHTPVLAADTVARLWAQWSVKNGIYPRFTVDPNLERLNALSEELDDVERRFGPNNPRTIPLRMAIVPLQSLRAASHGDIPPADIQANSKKLTEAMFRHGMMAGLTDPASDPAALDKERSLAKSPDQLREIAMRVARASVRAADPQFLPLVVEAALNEMPTDADKIALLDSALARLGGSGFEDHRKRLLFAKADIQRSAGDAAGRRKSLRAAGVPETACAMNDKPAKIESGEISPDDYPKEALRHGIAGRTVVEFDLDPKGAPRNIRVIMSAPAGIFDDVTTKKLAEYRYTTPTRAGRSVSCTGRIEQITWRLPDGEEEVETFEQERWNGDS